MLIYAKILLFTVLKTFSIDLEAIHHRQVVPVTALLLHLYSDKTLDMRTNISTYWGDKRQPWQITSQWIYLSISWTMDTHRTQYKQLRTTCNSIWDTKHEINSLCTTLFACALDLRTKKKHMYVILSCFLQKFLVLILWKADSLPKLGA